MCGRILFGFNHSFLKALRLERHASQGVALVRDNKCGESSMRCRSTLAIAAALAAALAVAAPAHAQHHWGGGHHHGGYWGGAALGGFAAGALLGSALAGPNYYYYDEPGYYEGPDVYAGPGPGAEAYCAQRYRSYDPGSGTFLGYDGMRHPCP
jgi:BA14K-like protein